MRTLLGVHIREGSNRDEMLGSRMWGAEMHGGAAERDIHELTIAPDS